MPAGAAALERAIAARVTRRLMPLMFVLFMANYLDRVNVSFAALQMNLMLGLSATAYGLGAGMFFLGYCLCQVPSNLLLARVGARRWIGGLAIAWGALAMAMMLIRGPTSFYVLRFLLGVVEAGFFPGMMFYLTHWFPDQRRARAVATFMAAIPVAQIVGGPLSGALLGLHGILGLSGWQWLFVLEGIPSVVLGLLVLSYLTETPEDASWLTVDQRAWLREQVPREGLRTIALATPDFEVLLQDPSFWWLTAQWILLVLAGYGQLLWLPQIIQGASGLSNFSVGVLSTIPPLAAAIAMVLVGAHSDRTMERRGHVAAASLVAGAGFLATAAAIHSPLAATAALSVVAIGIAASFGPFWGLATAALPAGAAATGIALVNSIGNLGGFAGPWVVGLVKDTTGSFAGALVAFALLCMLAALLARLTPLPPTSGS